MVLECFQWIVHLLNESVGLFSFSTEGGVVRQLPDDVVVDILSRLPVERVVECRRVCRNWRLLTSSHHFIKLHLSRATTQLVLSQPMFYHRKKRYVPSGKGELGLFIYDPTIKKRNKLKKLRLRRGIVTVHPWIKPFVSCDGLLLFLLFPQGFHWLIFNPVTQEQIAVAVPPGASGVVCGFFYHPVKKEYNILYRRDTGKYFMYTLGNQVWRSINARVPLDYAPSHIPPAIFNGALHWTLYWDYTNAEEIPPCSHGLVVFDMNTEEFSTKSHPGKECLTRRNHRNMSLLATEEDKLLFGYLEFSEKYMDIWILEDYPSWVWVQKWKLNLNLPVQPQLLWSSHEAVKLLHFEDGQLLLSCQFDGLYLYELDNNAVKKLQGPPPGWDAFNIYFYTIFTKSPISLRHLFFDKVDANNILQIHDGGL